MEEKRELHKENTSSTSALLKEQLKVAKKQLFHARLISILLLVLTITIGFSTYTVLPDLNSILGNLNEIAEGINKQEPIDIDSLNGTLSDLEKILNPITKLLEKTGS